MSKMENKLKRKRTSNFTAEEKLRFVRLLCEQGQCIISKVTAHDAASNKEKEHAWTKITQIHNSGGSSMRTTETLKKQWGKLKSEAKVYKAASRHSVSGTGGGPHKHFDDPVLELVADITGRASTGILNIDDCDAVADENIMRENDFLDASAASIEYIDESIFLEDFPEEKITAIKVPVVDQVEDVKNVIIAKCTDVQENNRKENGWASRRRPEINCNNERTDKMKKQQQVSNRFAAERLRAEQEKTNLVLQQIKQNSELHNVKMENEKLKKELLQTLLKKALDAETKDIGKVAAQFLFESE